MTQRRTSGELDAAYAAQGSRRRRERKSSLPRSSAMRVMATPATVAGMTPQRPSKASSRPYLQKNRSVTVRKEFADFTKRKPDFGQAERCGDEGDVCGGAEGFDERAETRRGNQSATPLKEKLLQDSGAFLREKLVYDELFRYQRSRAEDMARLLSFLQREHEEERDEAERDEHDTFRRASGFREEWRIGTFK